MMNNIQQCEARIRGLDATYDKYTALEINNKPRPTCIKGSLTQAVNSVYREINHYRNILQMLKEEQQ